MAYCRQQTIRFEALIYQRCLQSSKSAVAQELQLHYSTVDTIFKRYAKRQAKRCDQRHVRSLDIDEIALKKRHKQYVLILSDLQRRCIIAALPSLKQAAHKAWFGTLSYEQRQAICAISMGMWQPYRAFIKRYCHKHGLLRTVFMLCNSMTNYPMHIGRFNGGPMCRLKRHSKAVTGYLFAIALTCSENKRVRPEQRGVQAAHCNQVC